MHSDSPGEMVICPVPKPKKDFWPQISKFWDQNCIEALPVIFSTQKRCLIGSPLLPPIFQITNGQIFAPKAHFGLLMLANSSGRTGSP